MFEKLICFIDFSNFSSYLEESFAYTNLLCLVEDRNNDTFFGEYSWKIVPKKYSLLGKNFGKYYGNNMSWFGGVHWNTIIQFYPKCDSRWRNTSKFMKGSAESSSNYQNKEWKMC